MFQQMIKGTDIVEYSHCFSLQSKEKIHYFFSLKSWEKKKLTVKTDSHLEEVQTSFERGFIYQIVNRKRGKIFSSVTGTW